MCLKIIKLFCSYIFIYLARIHMHILDSYHTSVEHVCAVRMQCMHAYACVYLSVCVVCMCLYVCIYLSVLCVCVCMCVSVCLCCVYVSVCVYLSVRVVCMCLYLCICLSVLCVYVCICVSICLCEVHSIYTFPTTHNCSGHKIFCILHNSSSQIVHC